MTRSCRQRIKQGHRCFGGSSLHEDNDRVAVLLAFEGSVESVRRIAGAGRATGVSVSSLQERLAEVEVLFVWWDISPAWNEIGIDENVM